MDAETPAPALGYSILANLGDEKQLTVQCFVDSEASLGDIHAALDKALVVIDRQKARYKVKDLRVELEKMQRTLGQMEADLGNLETAFEANQKAVDERIADCKARVNEINAAAYGRGREGPVGADKAQVSALTKELAHHAEEKAKAQAERKQARDNTAVTIGRYQEEIARVTAQVAECEALIGEGG